MSAVRESAGEVTFMKRLITAVFLLAVVFGGSAAFSKTARPDLNKEVFYQIIIRSFYDSNGDGVGDIKGLDMKLDYLQELGVTTIWVTPIFASHVYHNYFADDFYKIDPSLGTLATCDRKPTNLRDHHLNDFAQGTAAGRGAVLNRGVAAGAGQAALEG